MRSSTRTARRRRLAPLTLAASLFALTPGPPAAAEPPVSAQASDLRAELARLDAAFDGFCPWFGARLDPVTGGVFHSAATQAEPDRYPPHLEATSKYVNVLAWSGRLDALPEGTRAGLVRFFRSHQVGPDTPGVDPRHVGAFMDAGYPDLDPRLDAPEVGRRDYAAARATGMSLKSLALLGAEPAFPPPGTAGGGAPPAHLASPEAFAAWLDGQPWTRAWTAGSGLLAQAGAIDRLADPLLRTGLLDAAWGDLAARQDPATGAWGDRGADGHFLGDNADAFILLNGAHKVVAFFERFGRPVPHADALAAFALRTIRTHQPDNLLHVYNASQLMRNLTRGRGQADPGVTPEELTAFVARCADRLARFRRPDGGFARGLVAQPADRFGPASPGPVSDTDASGLALKTRDNLWLLATGEPAPPLAGAEDPRLFGGDR